MRIDGYTKLVLTVIAVALALLALRPLLSPGRSYAARPIEYKVIHLEDLVRPARFGPAEFEKGLNQVGKEGWDIVLEHGALLVMKR